MLESQRELKTEKFQMLMEKSTMEAVDDWGLTRRIRTRAEAIRQLIHMGLDASGAETQKADAA